MSGNICLRSSLASSFQTETCSVSDACLHLASSILSRTAPFVHTEVCILHAVSCKAVHISEQSLFSFSDSLVPAQHLHRRIPAPPQPPHPLPPPRRSRRSFCLKIPSCHCTPAAQWAVRTSSSLLQDKVTHTHAHTHELVVSSLTLRRMNLSLIQ